MKKFTIEEIQKLVGEKYTVVKYEDSTKGVLLSCPIHGEFKLRIDHIKEKIGTELCRKCKKEQERIEGFKRFEENGNKTHNGKYTYHLNAFKNMSSKTIITCPVHGDFEQVPLNHIHGKQGCPICANEKKLNRFKYTREEIIEMCKKTHGDKYIYDDVIFQGMKKKLLNIRCPKHGYFDQSAYDHIRGFGCEKCKFENQTMTKDEFIKKAIEIHHDKYIYDRDKINYVNNHIKVPIICKKHGEFWQIPANHLLGIGCPYCNTSKLEDEIKKFLEKNDIKYIQKFHCEWLGRLELDFFLPSYNIAIECQGMQHFQAVEHFNGENGLKNTKERDARKLELCTQNGVKLLYYSNLGIEYPYSVYENKDDLLKEIRGF